jgi:membrane AbrB-like protein
MFSQVLLKRIFGGLAALVGAGLAIALNVPLPWLLGPLFTVAILRLLQAPVAAYQPLRNVGQWAIGVSLGVYFSPDIVGLIADNWAVLFVGFIVSLLLAIAGTWIIANVGRVDIKTAWFSAAIGGASEMSILAERYGARVDLVASAHSLRVLAVVTIIPFGFEWSGIIGAGGSSLGQPPVDPMGLIQIGLLAIVIGHLFSRCRIVSAWILGPLLAAALLSVFEVTATTIPNWVVNSGQLFLGWSLGDRYRPAFFKAAPRFLTAVAVFSVGAIAVVALVGLVISSLIPIALPTIWLGMAPGGLAEMAITAKVLMLGVPMVTALQVSRMAFVVIVTGWIYQHLIEPRFRSTAHIEDKCP